MTDTPASDLPIGTLKRADAPELAEHTLILDSQDIEAMLDRLPAGAAADLNGVTGMLVLTRDADTIEVWASEASRPFDVATDYQRIF